MIKNWFITKVQVKLKFQIFLSDIRENRINMKSDKMRLLYLEYLVLRLFSDLNKTVKTLINARSKLAVLTDSDFAKAWVSTRIRHSFSLGCQRLFLLHIFKWMIAKVKK